MPYHCSGQLDYSTAFPNGFETISEAMPSEAMAMKGTEISPFDPLCAQEEYAAEKGC